MQAETAIDRFLTTVASFSRELNTARKTQDVYQAIIKVLRRFFDISSFHVEESQQDKTWVSAWNDPDFPLSAEDLKPFIQLAVDRRSFSFYPLETGSLMILPTIKSGQVVSVLMGYILNDPEEFLQEHESVLGFISFFSGIVLENLRLYQEVLDSSIVQEGLKQYFKTMLDSLDEAISVWDESLSLVFSNQSYIRLNPTEKVIQIVKDLVAQSYQQKKGIAQEKEIDSGSEDLQNRLHFFSFNSVLLGEPDQVLVRMEDITNTKELERIKKIEQIRTEFVANISHELRTPLSAIKAYAETMRDSFSSLDEETAQQFMHIILDQSDHLEFLLNQLLDFSRLENHTMQLEITTFNLVQQAQDIYSAMHNGTQNEGVEFLLESDTPEKPVKGDANRIKQVMMNLVSNAVKYRDRTKEKKWVKIQIKDQPDSEKVIVSVEDNGVGIASEHLEKIFEKFYRVNSSLTYEVEGTGLGLAIVKEIIEKHEEQIQVKSESGKGSIFYFSLKKAI